MDLPGIARDFAARNGAGALRGTAEDAAAPALLLAGKNRTACKVIVKILESYKIRVRHVARGDDALDALLRGNIALALIDANLPVMTGVEVARRYRFAAIGRKRIPILGLVGGGPEPIGACIDAGMDGCLPKPVEPIHLLEAVRPFVQIGVAAEAAAPTPGSGELAAINVQVLKDLEQLGGRQFVEDVVAQFVADANRILPELAAAIAAADVEESRDLLHALRSCAANVGATAIFELCLAWRAIDREELAERGDVCLTHLYAEFEHARLLMADYMPINECKPPLPI